MNTHALHVVETFTQYIVSRLSYSVSFRREKQALLDKIRLVVTHRIVVLCFMMDQTRLCSLDPWKFSLRKNMNWKYEQKLCE